MSGRAREQRAPLLESFGAECEVGERFSLYAVRAEGHGYPQVGRLFRVLAVSHRLHAHRFLKAAGEIRGMEGNLTEALRLQTRLEEAHAEGEGRANRSGDARAEKAHAYAGGAERAHRTALEEALRDVAAGGDAAEVDYLVCRVCGHIVEGTAPPARCPVCGSPAKAYFRPNLGDSGMLPG